MFGPPVSRFAGCALRARPDALEDVGEADSGPECGREAGRAPGEAERLGDDVLLFAAVAGADEGDGEGDSFELGRVGQVGEGQGARVVDEAADLDGPARGFEERDLGHWAMVADVVERRRREEASVPEVGQRRFGVEGPLAGQADEAVVARDPLVRRRLGLRIGFARARPRRRQRRIIGGKRRSSVRVGGGVILGGGEGGVRRSAGVRERGGVEGGG